MSGERRIRPFTNDEDECDDGPQSVGSGCADFTPSEEAPGETLKRAARFVLRMRRSGATYVKLGDIEVSYMEPTAKAEG